MSAQDRRRESPKGNASAGQERTRKEPTANESAG